MDKILNNLGLAMKSGSVTAGIEIVIEGMRHGNVYLVFLATDASDNAKKKINDKAKFYNVEVCEKYSSLELSNAIGKNGRMVLGITNKGFVKILKN